MEDLEAFSYCEGYHGLIPLKHDQVVYDWVENYYGVYHLLVLHFLLVPMDVLGEVYY